MPNTRHAIPNRAAASSGRFKQCSRGTATTGVCFVSLLMTFHGSRNPPLLRSRALVMTKVWPPEGTAPRVGAALPSEWTLDRTLATFATGLYAFRRNSLVGSDSVFPSLFDQLGVLDVACPPKAAYREGSPQRSRWASLPLSGALGDGKVPGLNPAIKAQPALVRVIGVLIKRDSQRAVLVCISRTALGADLPVQQPPEGHRVRGRKVPLRPRLSCGDQAVTPVGPCCMGRSEDQRQERGVRDPSADGLGCFREQTKASSDLRHHQSIIACRECFRLEGTAHPVIDCLVRPLLSQVRRERAATTHPVTESAFPTSAVPLAEWLADIHRP